MPKREYALVRGGPKELIVSIGAFYRNARVVLRGEPILTFETKRDFERGASAVLADGSRLSVRLVSSGLTKDLDVMRNHRPVPGSMYDPAVALRNAAGVFGFVGVAFGLNAAVTSSVDPTAGVWIVIEALLFLAAAFGTYRRKKAALVAGIALLALDTLVSLANALMMESAYGHGAVVGMVLMRSLFFVLLSRGFQAFARLDDVDAEAAAKVFE